ncbi:iron chelate uptake ABC transporter family permease subunit [Streptomyces albidoflavus]
MTASAPEAPAPAGRAGEAERRAGRLPGRLRLPLLAVLTLLVALAALALGRYVVPPNEIVRLLAGQFLPVDRTWTGNEETVVLDVRLPRVLLSLLVGGGLALAGAALQGVFRNPLVSPDVIGVASGASFGGVLAMLLGIGSLGVVTGAFGAYTDHETAGDPATEQVLLYEDRVSTPGRLLVTTMDPVYHHGSRFMPGATQLLLGLLRWTGVKS